MTRRGDALVPASRAALDELQRLRDGANLLADVRQPRNVKHHRMFWALCTYVANALNAGPGETEWTQELVADRLKIATGRAEVLALPAGLRAHYGAEVAVKPASISFAAMDQAEFAAFANAAVRYLLAEFGPWIAEHPDWRHVQDILSHAKQGAP